MKQKYKDGGDVISPGTVIISAAGNCNDITKTVEPVLQKNAGSIYYVNLSKDHYKLGGSSFAQVRQSIGSQAPTVNDTEYLKSAFNAIQDLIRKGGAIVAGHDVASGGLITTLLELCFSDLDLGANLNLSDLGEADTIKVLFSENSGIVFQVRDKQAEKLLETYDVDFVKIGEVVEQSTLSINNHGVQMGLNIVTLRDVWYKTSYLLDAQQTANGLAKDRYENYKKQPLQYSFPQKPSLDLEGYQKFEGARLKRLSYGKKVVIQNVKWRMPCIWPVLM